MGTEAEAIAPSFRTVAATLTRIAIALTVSCVLIVFGGAVLFNRLSHMDLRESCAMTGLKCEHRIAAGEFGGIWPYASAVYEVSDKSGFEAIAQSSLTETVVPAKDFIAGNFDVDSGWLPTRDLDSLGYDSNDIDFCYTGRTRKIAETLAFKNGNFFRRAAGGPGDKTGTVCWLASPDEKLIAIGENHD